MTPRIPEEFSTRLSGWSPFVIMGNAMPPRDPEEDEEDGDEEEEDDEDEEDEEVQVDQGRGSPQGYDRASVPAAQDNYIRSSLITSQARQCEVT